MLVYKPSPARLASVSVQFPHGAPFCRSTLVKTVSSSGRHASSSLAHAQTRFGFCSRQEGLDPPSLFHRQAAARSSAEQTRPARMADWKCGPQQVGSTHTQGRARPARSTRPAMAYGPVPAAGALSRELPYPCQLGRRRPLRAAAAAAAAAHIAAATTRYRQQATRQHLEEAQAASSLGRCWSVAGREEGLDNAQG